MKKGGKFVKYFQAERGLGVKLGSTVKQLQTSGLEDLRPDHLTTLPPLKILHNTVEKTAFSHRL